MNALPNRAEVKSECDRLEIAQDLGIFDFTCDFEVNIEQSIVSSDPEGGCIDEKRVAG